MHPDAPYDTTYVPIRDMPASERPRERLASHGPEALSIAELVAIVWRTGTSGTHRESALDLATRALAVHGGLTGLARASLAVMPFARTPLRSSWHTTTQAATQPHLPRMSE